MTEEVSKMLPTECVTPRLGTIWTNWKNRHGGTKANAERLHGYRGPLRTFQIDADVPVGRAPLPKYGQPENDVILRAKVVLSP